MIEKKYFMSIFFICLIISCLYGGDIDKKIDEVCNLKKQGGYNPQSIFKNNIKIMVNQSKIDNFKDTNIKELFKKENISINDEDYFLINQFIRLICEDAANFKNQNINLVIILDKIRACKKNKKDSITEKISNQDVILKNKYEEIFNTSPINIVKQIYYSENADDLMKNFKKFISIAQENLSSFIKVLEFVYRSNDNVNLLQLEKNYPNLSDEDKLRIVIRSIARSLLCMGEIKNGEKYLSEMLLILNNLSNEKTMNYYFMNFIHEAYNAMAKKCPEKLSDMIKQNQLKDPGYALLALLRNHYNVSQENIIELYYRYKWPLELIYYLDNPEIKITYLNEIYESIRGMDYLNRMYRQRDVINAYLSFPEGIKEVEKKKNNKEIDYIRINNIFFGTIKGSNINIFEIKKHKDLLNESVGYIEKANNLFDSKEKTLYIDITPDKINDNKFNTLGWGNNCLFLTIGVLSTYSKKALILGLLHETCEQKFVKGFFSVEFGKSYLNAFNDDGKILKIFKLGTRIGGGYQNTGLGHPWDSEREWLAEVGSAFIYNGELTIEAENDLRIFNKMIENNKK